MEAQIYPLVLRVDDETAVFNRAFFYETPNSIRNWIELPAPLEKCLHLIDVADPDQIWSLAMFQQAAHRAIAEIQARGRLPFLVGGTGQYIRAVTEDWKIPRAAPDTRLRDALNNWAAEIGADGLHHRLETLDPAAAARIDPRNLRRTIRRL